MPELNVNVPELPHPGGTSQADHYRTAARNIGGGYQVGGSHMTRAVQQLLHNVAAQLDGQRVPVPEPTGVHADRTLASSDYRTKLRQRAQDVYDNPEESYWVLDVAHALPELLDELEEREREVATLRRKVGTLRRVAKDQHERLSDD